MRSPQVLSLALSVAALVTLGISTMSQSNAQSPSHVFEYRKYYAMPGKLDELKTRFRDHTITIFNRHNMKSVGYWIPQDNKDNALIYILQHPSREEAKTNWAAFNADPEWQKARAASEANGKLVDHVDSVYMDPADFSAMK